MTISTQRLFAGVLLISLIMLAACSKNKKKDGALTDNEQRIPEHFKFIPADSPFVITSIKTVPYKQLGWNVDAQFANAMKTLKSSAEQMTQMYGTFEQAPPDARLMLAVLEELDGRNSLADLKELGITDDGHFSMYGIGVFPALRLELGDAQLFEAMLQRVEARVGESVPTKTIGSRTFRAIEEDGLMIPIIVTDSELLIGVTSVPFATDFVGYLVGDKKPAKSMYDENNLLTMQKQYGMLPYVSGYADFRGITAAMLKTDTSSLTAQTLNAMGEPIPDVSEQCKVEYTKLVGDMPRVVFGYTELTRGSVKATMGLEVTSDLPKRLMPMKANSPAYGSDVQKNALMAMTLGINIDKTIEVLRNEAQRVGSDPYTCENLTWMNESAEEFYFNAQQIPPVFRTVLGSSFILSDLDIDVANKKINKINFMTILNNADPTTFFSALKLFFPDLFGGIDPKTDLQPVAIPLPADLMSEIPGLPTPMMVMSPQALGVSLGQEVQTTTKDYVKTSSDTPSPVMSFSYDMKRIMELIIGVMRDAQVSPEELSQFEAMMSTYKDLGPTTVSFDVQENGFFINIDAVMMNGDK